MCLGVVANTKESHFFVYTFHFVFDMFCLIDFCFFVFILVFFVLGGFRKRMVEKEHELYG